MKDVIIRTSGEISNEEIKNYIEYIEKKHDRKLKYLNIIIDGEYVDLSYEFEPIKIERIRRITGYLVGTVDRFNDAKTAEVNDRVKHGLDSGMETL